MATSDPSPDSRRAFQFKIDALSVRDGRVRVRAADGSPLVELAGISEDIEAEATAEGDIRLSGQTKIDSLRVHLPAGDLGQGQVQKFDIETWMPSLRSYDETHSASRFDEFQARRLKLRYRDGNRNTVFCHTLNNTVIASPRILISLVENLQNADGTIRIPEALRPYMGGRDCIKGGWNESTGEPRK